MSNHQRSLAKSLLLHALEQFNTGSNGLLCRPLSDELAKLIATASKEAGWEFFDGDIGSWGSPLTDITLVDLIVKLVELDCDEYSFAGTSCDIKRHLRAR